MARNPVTQRHHQELAALCPPGDYITDKTKVNKLSKDYYWYSPRLAPLLDSFQADAVVLIRSTDLLKKIVAYAAKNNIVLTPRGAGTGNYGQGVPLQGGLLLDMRPLADPLEIDDKTGILRATAGVRCQTIEEFARQRGWELPMYPSTWVKSTIGGFLAGGSAGIGSIRCGVLRDGKMVSTLSILDSKKTPTLHRIERKSCLNYLHAYGINGFIVEAEIQLVKKLPWEQIVFSHRDAFKLFGFAHDLAQNESIRLRLLNFQQYPIPNFFTPIKKYYVEGDSILQIEVTTDDLPKLQSLAEGAGLSQRLHFKHKEPRRAPMLSDFVQNHSTLWAKKTDPSYTYLAAKIDFQNWEKSVRAIMDCRNPIFALRADFNKTNGNPSVAAGPIFRAESLEDLKQAEEALHDIGVYFYDVHSPFLDRRGMETMHASKISLKAIRDPANILSIGKLSSEAPTLKKGLSESW